MYGHYERAVDRESAYEKLTARAAREEAAPPASARKAPASSTVGVIEAFAKSTARAVGSQLGRQIIRGVLGSILGGRRR
jgi:hypothetical protein